MALHLSRLLSALLCVLMLTPVMKASVSAADDPLVVIVGATMPIKDISTSLLRRAFLGEAAEYAPGKRLIPLNHPVASPMRERLDLALLGLKPHEVGRFWVDRRIRDQPLPPRAVPVEMTLRIVTSLPGAISYVTPGMLNDKVRALTIDGKSPGQPGYLFAR